MISNFWISYKVKISYMINAFLYSLRQISLLKNVINDGIYGNEELKKVGCLFYFIFKLLSTIFSVFLYIFCFIYLLLSLVKSLNISSILNVFLFLSLVGSFLNNYVFDETNDKYYLIMNIKMNAKKYILVNYIFYLVKTFFCFFIVLLVFFSFLNINIMYSFFISLFVCSSKINILAIILKLYKKDIDIQNNKNFNVIKWIVIILFIFLSYVFPYFRFNLPIIFYNIIYFISYVFSFVSTVYIFKYNYYFQIFNHILKQNDMNSLKESQLEEDKKRSISIIEKEFSSNKCGCAYFNDLFIKRHSKVLYKLAKNITFYIILIVTFLCFIMLLNNNLKIFINDQIIRNFPLLLFLMNFFNVGKKCTKIMFMNCDSSMLTLNFYKNRKIVIDLFKERLKSIIKINLLPSLFLSFGIILLLFFSGGVNNLLNYVLIFFAINSMSIFFSVHSLVMYYLLQPFNYQSDAVSVSYKLVYLATCYISYYISTLNISIWIFCFMIIIFSVVYFFISIILVYKYASKTFKIRA